MPIHFSLISTGLVLAFALVIHRANEESGLFPSQSIRQMDPSLVIEKLFHRGSGRCDESAGCQSI